MSTRMRRALAGTALTLAVAGVPTAASATATTDISASTTSQGRLCLSNQEGIIVAPGVVLCGNFVLNTDGRLD